MAMKRSSVGDSLESIRSEYKRARKAYKDDKSNEALKKAKSDAKKALKKAEEAVVLAAEEVASSSSDVKIDLDEQTPSVAEQRATEDLSGDKNDSNGNDGAITETSSSDADMKALEDAYQKALAAFKTNKNDKDLRRAKTAARRALDAAILAAASANDRGGKQIVCMNCSKKFILSTQEQKKYKKKKHDLPKRCIACKEAHIQRQSLLRSKLDGKKKNMCYAFQRGECPHGVNCKFSHNPKHGGKRINSSPTDDSCQEENEERKDDGNDVSDVMETKDRKEQSLRRKGKGWRNK